MTKDLDEVRRLAIALDEARDELHFAELAVVNAKAKVDRLKARHEKAILNALATT